MNLAIISRAVVAVPNYLQHTQHDQQQYTIRKRRRVPDQQLGGHSSPSYTDRGTSWGRKLWIESTNVFACLYSSRIWGECSDEDMYAESSLVLLGGEGEDDEEELCLLGPQTDRGAVSTAAARILSIPDDFYQAIVIQGDATKYLDGFIGTSHFTDAEMHEFFSKNSKRQYVFENCSFNPQQAAALLKNSTKVDIVLAGCSFDEDCHSLSAYSELLLSDDMPRSGKLRFQAHGLNDTVFLRNLSFVENMLLDTLVLSALNMNEDHCRRAGSARVNSLALENCRMKEGAEVPVIDSIRSGEMYASEFNVIEEGTSGKTWWKEVLRAIGSPQCSLQTVRFEGTKWSPALCSILIESLRTNEKLMQLSIFARPSDFGDQWDSLMEMIGSHKTLRKVRMLPEADNDSKWETALDGLFSRNQRITLSFHSNNCEEHNWSLKWNDMCLKSRFGSIPRMVEDGTRSFVLRSVMAIHSQNADHLFSLLKANQDLLSMSR